MGPIQIKAICQTPFANLENHSHFTDKIKKNKSGQRMVFGK
jgi:hypothetical protein